MSVRTDAYHVVLASMKGRRVDARWQAAAEVVDALVAAGIIPSEHDELLAAMNDGSREARGHDRDTVGICRRCGQGVHAVDLVDGEERCSGRAGAR